MEKVDMFIMNNSKFFESSQVPALKEKLGQLTDNQWSSVEMIQFKDPTIILIISLLAGSLGIDRFMLGHTGMGIGKLLTCGGFGIWTIIDWFSIMGATRTRNLQKLQEVLASI